MTIIALLIPALFIIIIIFECVAVLTETERAVIFRLGKFQRVASPGLHIICPFIDRLVKVKLNQTVPDWQTMSSEQLNARVKEIVLSGSK